MKLRKLIKEGVEKVRLAHWQPNEHVHIEDKNNVIFSILKRSNRTTITDLVCDKWEPYKN